jgi:hypothetical protein
MREWDNFFTAEDFKEYGEITLEELQFCDLRRSIASTVNAILREEIKKHGKTVWRNDDNSHNTDDRYLWYNFPEDATHAAVLVNEKKI